MAAKKKAAPKKKVAAKKTTRAASTLKAPPRERKPRTRKVSVEERLGILEGLCREILTKLSPDSAQIATIEGASAQYEPTQSAFQPAPTQASSAPIDYTTVIAEVTEAARLLGADHMRIGIELNKFKDADGGYVMTLDKLLPQDYEAFIAKVRGLVNGA